MVPIQPARAAYPMRQASPIAPKKPDLDIFVRSPAPVEIDSPKRPEFWRQAAAGLFMGTATVVALVAAPQTVKAAQPPGQAVELLTGSRVAKGQSIPLQQGLQQLKPEARQCLEHLPDDVQQVFVNLEPKAMQWLLEKVNGTTWVSFIPISNREALVSGTALGGDVFERALAGLKEQISKGTIPAPLEGKLSNLLLRLKGLTPDQRNSLVQALERQFPSK